MVSCSHQKCNGMLPLAAIRRLQGATVPGYAACNRQAAYLPVTAACEHLHCDVHVVAANGVWQEHLGIDLYLDAVLLRYIYTCPAASDWRVCY